MSPAFDYREFAPPEALRRHVRCLWHLTVDGDSGHVETVYPDGCCELIAHRKAPMHAFSESRRRFVGAAGCGVRARPYRVARRS